MRLLLFLSALILASALHAQEPEARASFSPNTAAVGDIVRFAIQITDAREVGPPPKIKVDGLDFMYTGPEEQMALRYGNGGISQTSTMTFNYQVTPRRAGQFTVPALTVQAGGRRFVTEPVALTVSPAGAARENRSGTAEIVLPRKTAYVGEALPTELRLMIDEEIRFHVDNVQFEADSFTKTKLADSGPSTIVRSGRSYDLVKFQTVLTPTKAGRLTAGPVVFSYVAQIPRAQARQPRSNNFFDRIFGDPGLSQAQRLAATSEPAEIEVKPLPTAGRPPSFSGAIGQFTLDALGAPARLKMGDPLTMRVMVRGTGNFDRVNAPVLADAAGWRAYPPTPSFSSNDLLGLRGVKTFEIAVIPEEKKSAMPVYEFSYFDPTAEKYVTLRTEAPPLEVEGVAALPASPEARGPGPVAASATPAPAAVKPTDIVGIRYDLGATHAAQPLYTQRAFLWAQLVPLGLLCGMVAARFWPRERAGRTQAAWRRERAALLSKLRRAVTRQEFCADAVRLLQVDTALRRGGPPELIEAAEVGEAPIVREIFETHAQARYAGAPAGTEPLPPEERQRLIDALAPLLTRS